VRTGGGGEDGGDLAEEVLLDALEGVREGGRDVPQELAHVLGQPWGWAEWGGARVRKVGRRGQGMCHRYCAEPSPLRSPGVSRNQRY